MKTIRCSSAPLAWVCPSSTENVPGEVHLNLSSEPAECGTAFHRWIASHVKGEELDQGSLAKEHGCDPDELRMLCANGARAWGKIGPMITDNFDTEYSVSAPIDNDHELRGTADVIGHADSRILVIDWKTGRLDSDYYGQLMGYAACAMDEHDPANVDEATVVTVWVRQGEWDVVHVNRKQVRAWMSEFSRRLANGRGNFNPGGHCSYCQRAASCPGRRALVKATIADWSGQDLSIMNWSPETREALGPAIGEAFAKAKLIEKAIEHFRDTLRDDVEQHGDLHIAPGRKLSLLTVNRRQIDAAKAMPALLEFLTAEEIDAATEIQAGKLDDAAMARAERGAGARTKRAMAAALEDAGAVTIKEEKQLREVRA